DRLQAAAEGLVGFRIIEVAADVEETAGKRVPTLLGDRRPRVAGDRFPHLAAEVVVGPGAPGDADDREAFRERLPNGEVVERRHQLAHRQVAGDAVDDHDAGGRHPIEGQPFAQGIGRARVLGTVAYREVADVVHLGREQIEPGYGTVENAGVG